ncbi:MAG: hypothetical protein RLZZ420_1611, partial [Bacteroidota bacterium]
MDSNSDGKAKEEELKSIVFSFNRHALTCIMYRFN